MLPWLRNTYVILLTKITVAENEVALSYHRVRVPRAIFSGSFFSGDYAVNMIVNCIVHTYNTWYCNSVRGTATQFNCLKFSVISVSTFVV